MSVKDFNQVISIIDGLNGNVLCSLPLNISSKETISNFICDFMRFDLEDQHGLIIRYGYKP